MNNFFVLDGPEGVGKSTQAKILAERIRGLGREVLEVREPGSTFIGEQIRSVILDVKNKGMDSSTELLLFMACRNELLLQIREALLENKIVVCDRYIASTYAYQQQTQITQVLGVADLCLGNWKPSVNLILDMPYERRRVKAVRDRIEQKPKDYHEEVRNRYWRLEQFDNKFFRILYVHDKSIEQVSEMIWDQIKELIV